MNPEATSRVTAEIAAALDCTQRKVQRKLNLVRLRWERELKG